MGDCLNCQTRDRIRIFSEMNTRSDIMTELLWNSRNECFYAEISEGTMRCIDCQENYCFKCSRAHKRRSMFRDHQLVEIDDKMRENGFEKTKSVKENYDIILCDICNEVNEEGTEMPEATMRCIDCGENHCVECSRAHKKQRLSRYHKVVEIYDQIRKPFDTEKTVTENKVIILCSICNETGLSKVTCAKEQFKTISVLPFERLSLEPCHKSTTEESANTKIKKHILLNLPKFVESVDAANLPKFVESVDAANLSDHLISQSIISPEQWEEISSTNPTSKSRTRALFNLLFISANKRAFIVVKNALEKEPHLGFLVEEIEDPATSSNHDTSTMMEKNEAKDQIEVMHFNSSVKETEEIQTDKPTEMISQPLLQQQPTEFIVKRPLEPQHTKPTSEEYREYNNFPKNKTFRKLHEIKDQHSDVELNNNGFNDENIEQHRIRPAVYMKRILNDYLEINAEATRLIAKAFVEHSPTASTIIKWVKNCIDYKKPYDATTNSLPSE